MLLKIFWILVVLDILSLIIWLIDKSESRFNESSLINVFIVVTIILGLYFLVIAFPLVYHSYSYYGGFKINYNIIVKAEKDLETKKENILNKSKEINSSLSSPDILSLKDKSYLKSMIKEIKETENTIVTNKLLLYGKILEHNGKCNYWWGGKWVVDINDFPLLLK